VSNPSCVVAIRTDLLILLFSISAARSSRSLSERRISHIVSVCSDPIPGELPESGLAHLRIPVEDVDYADLLIHLPTAVRFIDQAIRHHGVVLVHCVQGLSRSATVVAAYCEFASTELTSYLNTTPQ
jgi:dual specificity phosphatase 12